MVNGARVLQVVRTRQGKIGVVRQAVVNLRALKGFDKAANGRRPGGQPAKQFLKQGGCLLGGQTRRRRGELFEQRQVDRLVLQAPGDGGTHEGFQPLAGAPNSLP